LSSVHSDSETSVGEGSATRPIIARLGVIEGEPISTTTLEELNIALYSSCETMVTIAERRSMGAS